VRRARARRESLYAELAGAWFAGAAAPFLAALEHTAQELAAPHAPPHTPPPVTAASDDGAPTREIERKFLLRALPPRARDVAPDEIEQGWLPGERLIERLRRTRVGSAERYYRTVKLGAGVSRIEVEEETTPDVWTTLWPLTAERRIAKRRHKVAEGALVWEIDDFPALGLTVAEVELPDADAAPAPPEWLAPYVVREVTEERGFTNFELARHGVPGDLPA
jgi:CYTH domain-containing protein